MIFNKRDVGRLRYLQNIVTDKFYYVIVNNTQIIGKKLFHMVNTVYTRIYTKRYLLHNGIHCVCWGLEILKQEITNIRLGIHPSSEQRSIFVSRDIQSWEIDAVSQLGMHRLDDILISYCCFLYITIHKKQRMLKHANLCKKSLCFYSKTADTFSVTFYRIYKTPKQQSCKLTYKNSHLRENQLFSQNNFSNFEPSEISSDRIFPLFVIKSTYKHEPKVIQYKLIAQ